MLPLRSLENQQEAADCSSNLKLKTDSTSIKMASRAVRRGSIRENTSSHIQHTIRTEPFSDYYEVEKEIGRGKYAVVKRCRNRKTDCIYAAKFLRKRRKGKDCRQDALHEVQMLEMAMSHPYLIDLIEVFETAHEIIIITGYASGGELHTALISEEHFAEEDVQRIISQVLDGISYLHERNVVHLDVKPQNIVIMEDRGLEHIKLCDFGFARYMNSGEDIRDIIGTPDYVAPEVLSYEPISAAADMWSVGVLVYVLLTGYSPFAGDTKQETFYNISQMELDFPDDIFQGVSLEAKDFISRLLVKEPQDRLSFRCWRDHAWIKGASSGIDRSESSMLRPSTPSTSSMNTCPHGSPAGCRRTLTPPGSDSSLENEPKKRHKGDNASGSSESAATPEAHWKEVDCLASRSLDSKETIDDAGGGEEVTSVHDSDYETLSHTETPTQSKSDDSSRAMCENSIQEDQTCPDEISHLMDLSQSCSSCAEIFDLDKMADEEDEMKTGECVADNKASLQQRTETSLLIDKEYKNPSSLKQLCENSRKQSNIVGEDTVQKSEVLSDISDNTVLREVNLDSKGTMLQFNSQSAVCNGKQDVRMPEDGKDESSKTLSNMEYEYNSVNEQIVLNGSLPDILPSNSKHDVSLRSNSN